MDTLRNTDTQLVALLSRLQATAGRFSVNPGTDGQLQRYLPMYTILTYEPLNTQTPIVVVAARAAKRARRGRWGDGALGRFGS